MIHTPYEEGVEYRFLLNDGKIQYYKINCVYANAMTDIDYILYYTGDDQFYSETGYLEVQNENLVYVKTSDSTIYSLGVPLRLKV